MLDQGCCVRAREESDLGKENEQSGKESKTAVKKSI